MYVIERLIDLAARRHGFDRIALRRRNLVSLSAMPYRNPVGLVYGSGDYAAALDRLVELSDWKGFEYRRAARSMSRSMTYMMSGPPAAIGQRRCRVAQHGAPRSDAAGT